MRSAAAGKSRSEKIVLIGAASSGKTSIVNRFIHDKFSSASEATIGAAFISKVININGTDIKLEIWDTGGSEKYRSLAPMYYRDARAAIIVFDVTSENSFNEAHEWLNEFRERGQQNALLFCAANKCDLTNERVITEDAAQDFAFKNQFEAIKNTSALSGQGISDLFQELGKGLLTLPPLNSQEEIEVTDIAQPTRTSTSKTCDC